ncbi:MULTISPECIES: LysR family transcriptional regulator [unclassified Massilia]|uniref:LysR family transcriptional regulator n=1 Tax=unclassified Massilia TaxID=2609279 RepID=UPI001B8186F7|nr:MULTISPECIES: LysR family transcriptional regulator [unclassified Massilia]MBQ5940608.1 LysR family transcriptional regulator [Massilia sp. AB1]MBQ5964766.1 LysR family transcriptional regulator [Massilia sp. ZL223]
MDKVKAMQAFVRIVEANSFSKAAETLDLPRAALSASIKNLEAYLGAQLLQRTTRRLSLTPEGERYYQQCAGILAAIETAEAGFLGASSRPLHGKLRIDLPGSLGRAIVLPRIAQFREAYPDLALTISLSDRLVDLTQEGIDCAVRVGVLQDSALVARPLGSMRFLVAASPAYLARRGVPASIGELAGHEGIVHFSGRTGRAFDWELETEHGPVKLELGGGLAVNDAEANLCCALQGLGLAQLGRYQARRHLESGELVEVLPGVEPTPMPVSLLYPRGRMASPRLQAFAQWLETVFAGEPDLALRDHRKFR